MMTKDEMKDVIMEARLEKGLLWADVAKAAGMSDEFICSACLGMNHLEKEQADAVADVLGLGADISAALQQFPKKVWDQAIPNDPVVYRWYEMVGVYGDTIREIISEKFGDGIMSAIDFKMSIDKEEDPAGDRVLVTISGKFLGYKSW